MKILIEMKTGTQLSFTENVSDIVFRIDFIYILLLNEGAKRFSKDEIKFVVIHLN